MTTLEELFEEFQKLPDWNNYPLPEVFYKHFNVKKPQPAASLMESLTYTPPPHQSLNTNGKVEIREAMEGGVREIEEFVTLPVEVTLVDEETGELKEMPAVKSLEEKRANLLHGFEEVFKNAIQSRGEFIAHT